MDLDPLLSKSQGFLTELVSPLSSEQIKMPAASESEITYEWLLFPSHKMKGSVFKDWSCVCEGREIQVLFNNTDSTKFPVN